MFTRRIDHLRRIVIPSKLRNELKFEKYQEVEITIEYGCICIKAFNSSNINEKSYIGIVRRIDELGRICIPADYLNVLKIEKNTEFIITLIGEKVKIYPK